MKKLLMLSLMFLFVGASFGQKVKVKKDVVFVNGVIWGKVQKSMNTWMLSTVEGMQFARIDKNSYTNGIPDSQGKLKWIDFVEITFISTTLPKFDLKGSTKTAIKKMWLAEVTLEDKFVEENAEKFAAENNQTCVPRGWRVKR